MFKQLVIDPEHNRLLCTAQLVGNGEVVEIFSSDDDTPPQASGKLLRKIGDPNMFEIHTSFEDDSESKTYYVGEKCILRVLAKNLSGSKRRRFSKDEKSIVNMEKEEHFKEKKVTKSKTGSVRKRKRK